jgi:alpha,alpha-trehalase
MICDGPVFNITRESVDAVLFDLDGVVTKTAKVHAAAWKELFDEFLQRRSAREVGQFVPFDADADYNGYVDGKPRYDGIRSFLESRGIALPYGEPDDPPDRETVIGLGNRKNEIFHRYLKTQGVEPYEFAPVFLHLLRAKGFKTAVVSSSKNCAAVLAAAGLADLFDTKVDGLDSAALGLPGKPAPDIFLEAAKRLGIVPGRAVVLEDALSGVQAGRRGKFGCVVGVDRIGHAAALRENGADVTVNNLSQIEVEGERPLLEAGVASLPSALESMEEILGATRGKRLLVSLDYDGTLTPIVARPELAVLSKEMREAVIELANYCTVAVISGRDIDDVRGLVSIPTIFYAGSHGYDIAGPENVHLTSQQGEDFLPALDRAERSLHDLLDRVLGVLIERKRFSMAVHYRQVRADQVAGVESSVDRALEQHPDLRKGRGKKVFEIQPRMDWHKGKALLWLLAALHLNEGGVLPLYIGDDVTDEDAFKVLQGCGIGIVVRESDPGGSQRVSAAHYALNSPAEVHAFLTRLTGSLKGENG